MSQVERNQHELQANMSQANIYQNEPRAIISQADGSLHASELTTSQAEGNQHASQENISEPERNEEEIQAAISQFAGKLDGHYTRLITNLRRAQSALTVSVAQMKKLECDLEEGLEMFEDEK